MELIDLMNSVMIFVILNDLTQMVNFPSRTHEPVCLDLFVLSLVLSTVSFPPLQNSDHLVVSVSLDFSSNPKGDIPFHCSFFVILVLI